jgi:perosamine synthetase
MIRSIPRGKIYHKLRFEMRYLLKTIFYNLNNEEIVNIFEDKFAKLNGSSYCVAFPYARSAVYHSLKINNFEENSEIIMPPITIQAMLDAVLELGLKPIFVDIDLDTLSYDLVDLEKKISVNTKAILLTYLYGIVPNVDEIIKICKKRSIFIIEDFSQCLNGKFNEIKVGNFGDIGVYSSSTTKTLDLFAGGICFTNNSNIYLELKKCQSQLVSPSRIRILKLILIDIFRNLATNKVIFSIFTFRILKFLDFFTSKTTEKWVGDRSAEKLESIPKYWFEKFSSIQAKAGIEIIDSKILEIEDEKRIYITNKYREEISDVRFPNFNTGYNVYWQCIAYTESIIKTRRKLLKKNIDVATTSLPLLSQLPLYGIEQNTPNAKYLINNSIFIPNFSNLTKKEVSKIVESFND